MISLSPLNEFVLHFLFFIVPVAPVRPAVQESDFLVSISPEVRLSSVPALQDWWVLLWLLSVGMVDQYVALFFSTVTYPPVSPELQWSLRGLRSTGFHFSGTCPLWSSPPWGAVAINAFRICSLYHSLGIVLKKE